MSEKDDPPNDPAEHTSKTALGYGHPPAEHRFKKGVSGNPGGRPHKRKELPAVVLPGLHRLVIDEAYRQVRLREGDKTIELSVIQATIRALGVSGMKGDRISQLAFKEIVAAAEAEIVADRIAELDALCDHKGRWEPVFEQCKKEGRPCPDILPHPDDILVDLRRGDVQIVGPWDKRHKREWDQMQSRKVEYLEEIDELRKRQKRKPDQAAFWADEIASMRQLCEFIDVFLPDEVTRRDPGFDPHKRRRRMDALIAERTNRRARAPRSTTSASGRARKDQGG